MNPIQTLATNIGLGYKARREIGIDQALLETFDKVVNLVLETINNGGRVFIAGNGGSAADAQHLAAEFVGRFERERIGLPAEALTTDTSVITAIGNDYGYEDIFARQLDAKATSNDLFLAISTSGNSKNIIKALEYCKYNEIKSVLLTGRTGGKSKPLADFILTVPSDKISTIQNVHQDYYHSMIEYVEKNITD